jgi:hypothetical protein
MRCPRAITPSAERLTATVGLGTWTPEGPLPELDCETYKGDPVVSLMVPARAAAAYLVEDRCKGRPTGRPPEAGPYNGGSRLALAARGIIILGHTRDAAPSPNSVGCPFQGG